MSAPTHGRARAPTWVALEATARRASAPLLASACKRRRGNKLIVLEALGERQADYFVHE